MAFSRISTYALQQGTLSNAVTLQTRIFGAQQQISSGLKADNYSELGGGQVELLTSLENRIGKSDQYIKNNIQTISRLESTNTVLTQAIDLANDMKNLIAQRRNATVADSLSFEQSVRAAFSTAAVQLNTNVDGRYLFSGARTDTPPIQDDGIDIYHPVVPGTPDSGYYQGSTVNVTARIQDDYEVTTNIRADAEPFQQMMAAFSEALTGHAEADDALLQQAYDHMQEAVKGIINLQASVGTTRDIIDKTNTRHTQQMTYYRGVREDTVSADIIALSTTLARDQTALQASFQSFAKINSLQLSDYLR